MIHLTTLEGRALMRHFEKHPPSNDHLREVNDKLHIHENLITTCERARAGQPIEKEPA